MTRRERAIVAALADGLVAPVAPLPPVSRTDTVDAVERLLDAGPRRNRIALRGMMRFLDRRLHLRELGSEERRAAVDAAARDRVLGAVLDPVRGVVHLAYYGDVGVLRRLGYDPAEVLARAHRAEVGR